MTITPDYPPLPNRMRLCPEPGPGAAVPGLPRWGALLYTAASGGLDSGSPAARRAGCRQGPNLGVGQHLGACDTNPAERSHLRRKATPARKLAARNSHSGHGLRLYSVAPPFQSPDQAPQQPPIERARLCTIQRTIDPLAAVILGGRSVPPSPPLSVPYPVPRSPFSPSPQHSSLPPRCPPRHRPPSTRSSPMASSRRASITSSAARRRCPTASDLVSCRRPAARCRPSRPAALGRQRLRPGLARPAGTRGGEPPLRRVRPRAQPLQRTP